MIILFSFYPRCIQIADILVRCVFIQATPSLHWKFTTKERSESRYCRIPLSKMKLNSDSATRSQGSCLHVMGTCQSLYAIKILLSFSMCERSHSRNSNMQKDNQIEWYRPLDYVWFMIRFAAVYCCNFAEGPLNLNFSTQETLIRYQCPE